MHGRMVSATQSLTFVEKYSAHVIHQCTKTYAVQTILTTANDAGGIVLFMPDILPTLGTQLNTYWIRKPHICFSGSVWAHLTAAQTTVANTSSHNQLQIHTKKRSTRKLQCCNLL